MSLWRSRPQTIEAVQWRGDNEADMFTFGGGKVAVGSALTVEPDGTSLVEPKTLQLLAGKDGAQGWVPVPVGHWLVNAPGDKSDVWPVDPDYFAAKYEPAPLIEER